MLTGDAPKASEVHVATGKLRGGWLWRDVLRVRQSFSGWTVGRKGAIDGSHEPVITLDSPMKDSVRAGWLFVVVTLVIVGCGTSSQPVQITHSVSSNQTTYETRQIRLSGIQMTEGLERGNRFYMQVVGTCTGEDCVPRSYALNFIKEGMQPVQLEGRSVSLTIGTETLSWKDPQNRSVNRTSTIRSGTFAKVEITSKQLTTIGGVNEVTGTVGGEGFSLSHEARAPIRKLMARLEKRTDSSAGTPSS